MKESVLYLRQEAPSANTRHPVQSNTMDPRSYQELWLIFLAFHDQNWSRAGVPQRLLMLPQLQQLRCVKGQVAERKHSCFHIDIQEGTGRDTGVGAILYIAHF